MKKFLKNPWVLGIGTTVIGGLALTSINDWIQGVDWLSTFNFVIKSIFNAIMTFLNYELKVWWILLAIALVFAVGYIAVKIHANNLKNATPDFLSYTKDSILGYTWEWEYEKGYAGKYSIHNLHPICSKCGMNLKRSYPYGARMECLRCKETMPKLWDNSLRNDAQMLIEDNIKKINLQNEHK